MNALKHLLIDPEYFGDASTEKLKSIGSAAHDMSGTISHGIAAIGVMLASAAMNEDAGLNTDTVADLGWLLQALGKLTSNMASIEAAASSHIELRSTQKEA